MPIGGLPSTRPSRQPLPKPAGIAVPKGLAPKTGGQAGPIPRKLGALRSRGVPSKRAKATSIPGFGSSGVPGATDITPPSPIGSVGGGLPGSLPSFTAPPRPMNMPNMGLGHDSNKKNPKGVGSTRKKLGAGMSEARDRKLDQKAGIKQGSKKDNALDRKRGVPVRKGK